MESHITAIDSVTIVKLLCRLADTHPAEIGVQVNLRAHDLVGLPTPHCYLHLIVRIINACIEEVGLSVLEVYPKVTIPEVTVN